jgi:hypothetical protein
MVTHPAVYAAAAVITCFSYLVLVSGETVLNRFWNSHLEQDQETATAGHGCQMMSIHLELSYTGGSLPSNWFND